MTHKSKLFARFSVSDAEVVYKALELEALDIPKRRVKVRLSLERGELMISIEANDTTALRAALNSFVRWIAAVSQCLELVNATGRNA